MEKTAKLTIEGKTYELPIVESSEGDIGINVSKLRAESKYITFDPGFGNTGSCKSAITFINGEKGILRYRGIPIEQMADKSTFVETAFLLIYGRLPKKNELEKFSKAFTTHSMIHEDMKNFFNGFPRGAHPMAILATMVCSLSCYYPELGKPNPTEEDIDMMVVELLSKIRTICAFSYKKSIGEPFVYPTPHLKYVPNFLHMMFSSPTNAYTIDEDVVSALRTLLILHADHEQNCSTSTVRLVGSSQANLFGAVSAGIVALWGPLHGGANQKVIEMLEIIQKDGDNLKKYVDMAKDKKSSFRLMGFGHRVYKNFDPRAQIIKKKSDTILKKLGINDPLLDLAKQLEEIALKDDYFIERKLFPNVDFYSGIIYRAIGIPLDMFPVMFAIARLPGWIAQWKEMISDTGARIGRPRQIYIGKTVRDYIPIDKR